MGFEDEGEQSLGRPCRLSDGRSKRTYELTSSIVPRGTSFHRSVELGCSPIVIDLEWFSCCCDLPRPAELGAVDPDAMHDHGQPARQSHGGLLYSAVPGDLHRPGLEPGPFGIRGNFLVSKYRHVKNIESCMPNFMQSDPESLSYFGIVRRDPCGGRFLGQRLQHVF